MRRDSGFHLKTWRRTAAFAARAAAPPEFSANPAENPYPASGPLHQAPVYRFGPIEGFFVPDDQADGPALRPEFRRRAGETLALASGSSRCRIGREKPAVLPVPVCAAPITSRPASAAGIACT